MYLSQLKIENFRQFGEGEKALTLPLNAGLNVLVGENNAGKTTIIDAIRFALGTNDQSTPTPQSTDYKKSGKITFTCILQKDEEKLDGVDKQKDDEKLDRVDNAWAKWNEARIDEGIGNHPITLSACFTTWGKTLEGTEIEDYFIEQNKADLQATYLTPLRDIDSAFTAGRESRLAKIFHQQETVFSENAKKYFEALNPLQQGLLEVLPSEPNQRFSERLLKWFAADMNPQSRQSILWNKLQENLPNEIPKAVASILVSELTKQSTDYRGLVQRFLPNFAKVTLQTELSSYIRFVFNQTQYHRQGIATKLSLDIQLKLINIFRELPSLNSEDKQQSTFINLWSSLIRKEWSYKRTMLPLPNQFWLRQHHRLIRLSEQECRTKYYPTQLLVEAGRNVLEKLPEQKDMKELLRDPKWAKNLKGNETELLELEPEYSEESSLGSVLEDELSTDLGQELASEFKRTLEDEFKRTLEIEFGENYRQESASELKSAIGEEQVNQLEEELRKLLGRVLVQEMLTETVTLENVMSELDKRKVNEIKKYLNRKNLSDSEILFFLILQEGEHQKNAISWVENNFKIWFEGWLDDFLYAQFQKHVHGEIVVFRREFSDDVSQSANKSEGVLSKINDILKNTCFSPTKVKLGVNDTAMRKDITEHANIKLDSWANFIKPLGGKNGTSNKNMTGWNEDEKLSRFLQALELTPEKAVGLGYNNLMYIATELLLLEQKTEGIKLLLIEEPEAHLHPQLQLKLMKYLKKEAKDKDIQIIVTTHSPNLASAVKLEDMTMIQNGQAFSLAKKQTRLKGDDYPFLERFLDVSKANLFFARGVLIVEGFSEAILLPTLAKLIGRDLTNYGVSIVNVGGTMLEHYARIFQRVEADKGQINIPVACVTDMDVMPNCAPDILELQRDAKNRKWRTKSDFNDAKQELKEKRATIEIKLAGKVCERQSVRVFVADEWTLEYDLAYFALTSGHTCLAEEIYLAAKRATIDEDIALQPTDDTRKKKRGPPKETQEQKIKKHETAWKELLKDETELSSNDFNERVATGVIKLFRNGNAAKPIAAQHLAKRLEEINCNLEKECRENSTQLADFWRSVLPPYLVDAIEYVTEPLPTRT